MKRLVLGGLTFGLALTVAAAIAAGVPDGAHIMNSGSTNAAPYTIKIWSDGRGSWALRDTVPGKPFTVDPALAQRFFTDVKAARTNPGTPGHCMKSASFGTTTVVAWHAWRSFDLQCPPFTPEVTALANDVRQIQAAANVSVGPRRIPLPREPRMIPSTAPEVSPT